jgi:NADPH:quinone reductase-like Zn-dependent oxidoreductase
LQDFVPLKEGEWLLQNGANSAVGLAVIQLAKVNTRPFNTTC